MPITIFDGIVIGVVLFSAVLAMVRSHCRVKVFNLDHLVPTEARMVVTEADPARRIVRQINAAPAAQEYARLLGKDPAQLTTFTFAAHPVVVRIGGAHHVRAIQQVDANGDLIFLSAIDEGVVLTLAEPQDMAAHLSRALADLRGQGAAPAILACDCILRRMEALEKQMTGEISAVLSAHGVPKAVPAKAEKPAADDDRAAPAFGDFKHLLDIVEVAIGEHAWQLMTRDRNDEGQRSGGDDQLIVGHGDPIC